MRYRLLVLCVLALTILLLPAYSAAQEEDPPPSGADLPPPGVDLVFIVDQSGSMSRGSILNLQDPRCTPVLQSTCPRTEPTDPDGMAIKAVREGLQPIFNQILVRQEGRKPEGLLPEEHRIGVVLFGGNPNPDLGIEVPVPLTRIEIERDTDGRMRSNIERLLPTQVRNLGDTAFSVAFERACALLQCNVPPPPGRKRVIVLLTDGRPALDVINFDQNNPAAYFAELQRRHAMLFDHTELWVFGLDQQDQFWSRTAPYWREIATDERTGLLTDPADIAPKFREVALNVIGEPPAPAQECNGSFTIAPYLATVTLLLEYPDFDSKAVFHLPNGETLTSEAPSLLGYSYTGLSETFILRNPAPGEWSCQMVGTGVRPQFRNIKGQFSLARVSVGYAAGPLASTCDDFSLVVTYFDDNGNPIAELPGYPLQQTLAITIDDKTTTRNLVRDGAAADRWLLDGDVSPGTKGGTYPLDITVRYGEEVIFHDTSQTITIDPRLPCMHLITPRDGGTSSMHQRLSPIGARITVQLTQGGEPQLPEGIFREDLSQIVSAQLSGPGGFSQTVQLEPDSDHPGQFTRLVDGLQTAGVYTLTVTLRGTTYAGEVYELRPQTITFTRAPGMLWLIVEYAKRFGAAIAIIVALIGAGLFVFMVTGPFPRGTLLLEEKATGTLAQTREWNPIKTIPLSSQRIIFGLFRTRWPTIRKGLPKDMEVRKLKVRRYSDGRNEGVEVKVVRTKKKSALTFQFTHDKESRALDNNYRITYERPAYGKR